MAMSAARKARLRASAERAAREQYVRSASFAGRITNPFLDANWDAAAREYIETGDETLKAHFPAPRQEVAS